MTVHNFNAGPAALPHSVLQRVQAELLDYRGRGMSVMEMSHRSREFEEVNADAEARFKRLAGVGSGWRVLFLQGGASTQFALVPLNLAAPGQSIDLVVTGAWGEKAQEEAALVRNARLAGSTKEGGYRSLPERLDFSPQAAYAHLTTNETIHGVQWHSVPDCPTPLVADMSSDIFSRPWDYSRFSLVYAGAQKNLGPSGVTVVLLREELLSRAGKDVPTMFRYATHAKNNSLYNTPPAFGVYVLGLVLAWIEEQGGLAGMGALNEKKAALLYDAIDRSGGFYSGHADPSARSRMNVTFRLPDEVKEKAFLADAAKAGMVGLAGHRSVGGCRASIYNAVPLSSCEALAALMREAVRRG
ncbi:MAG: 3-phosphoserine/phosphohydroxythreonine transaminase [Gemmataceae bacterium]|nr:3-phosphoserine/phosphohydroxythreonine transaminase [Gemmataceae bacterium]